MFKNNNFKLEQLKREVVKMKNILRCMIFVVVAFCATAALAATTATVNVNATVPLLSAGLAVTINKIPNTQGAQWIPDTAVNFGSLILDPVNNIFTTGNPGFYYAVDAAVVDNSGNNWRITHTFTSLKKDAVNNLDGNVNVSFNKVHKVPQAADSDVNMAKFSLANSGGKSYTKSTLGGDGCWLRVYYGIGTGDPAKPDAPGVTPIGADKATGVYTGTVTLTYSPS